MARKKQSDRTPAQKAHFARFQLKGFIAGTRTRTRQILKDPEAILTLKERNQLRELHRFLGLIKP
jgi:hypothetical protein